MTETLTASRGLHGVTVRPYRPSDHNACRALWGELVEHRGALYGAAPPAGSDPGAGFEEYLTQLNLSGMWVADHEEIGVVAFVGLMLDGRSGQVDPVVVTESMRGRGIGGRCSARSPTRPAGAGCTGCPSHRRSATRRRCTCCTRRASRPWRP